MLSRLGFRRNIGRLLITYGMALPVDVAGAGREGSGMGRRIVVGLAVGAAWLPWRVLGLEARDSGVGEGTEGVAAVQVARAVRGAALARAISRTCCSPSCSRACVGTS